MGRTAHLIIKVLVCKASVTGLPCSFPVSGSQETPPHYETIGAGWEAESSGQLPVSVCSGPPHVTCLCRQDLLQCHPYMSLPVMMPSLMTPTHSGTFVPSPLLIHLFSHLSACAHVYLLYALGYNSLPFIYFVAQMVPALATGSSVSGSCVHMACTTVFFVCLLRTSLLSRITDAPGSSCTFPSWC